MRKNHVQIEFLLAKKKYFLGNCKLLCKIYNLLFLLYIYIYYHNTLAQFNGSYYSSPQLQATQKKLSSTLHEITLLTSQIWHLQCNLEDVELASQNQVFDLKDGLLVCPKPLSSTSVDKHLLLQICSSIHPKMENFK